MTDEDLVFRAEKIIVDRLDALTERQGESGRTQLSNAISVAQATDHPAVFINWLRYQRSREDFWRIDKAGREIAKDIHEAIETILKEFKGEEAMRRIVRFLGFLRRALIAKEGFEIIPASASEEGA